MNRAEKIEYVGLIEEQRRRSNQRIIQTNFDMMYDWQREFIKLTADHHEGCLSAANQIGKTFTGTTSDGAHLTGDYPEGWEGHRFEFPPMCWALGYSMEKTRDLLQTALFGAYEHGAGFRGGIVPKDRILRWERASGTANAMRTVTVRHASSIEAESTMQFWSYSQGQHAIMGDKVDWFHVDEEPKDQTIRPQVLTRTINGDNGRGGRGIYTFTPENGRTELVVKFKDNPSPSQFYMQKGWADAPHITPEKAKRLLESFPEYQRDMRSKGDPVLGYGRIFEISDEYVQCDPPEIQPEYFVINGMDFGDDHPQAHIQLIEDRENNRFYVTRAYRARKTSANDAWGAVKTWAEGVPTAWPHDGLQGEKGRDDSVQLKQHYADAGFNMLANHSTWPKGGNSVETGLFELNNLMRKGLFKICRGVPDVMDEFRQYHRKPSQRENNQLKIVKANDDLLDAIRYAYMMRRYAVRFGDVGISPKVINFAGWNG